MLGIYTIIHYQVRKRTWSHKIVPPDISGERMHQCVPAISCNCSDGTSLHCVFKNHRRTMPLCIQGSSFHGNIEAGKDETMHNSARPKQKHRCNLPFHLNEPAAPREWRWDCWTSGASRAVVERKLAKQAKVLYSWLIPCANIKQYHIMLQYCWHSIWRSTCKLFDTLLQQSHVAPFSFVMNVALHSWQHCRFKRHYAARPHGDMRSKAALKKPSHDQ